MSFHYSVHKGPTMNPVNDEVSVRLGGTLRNKTGLKTCPQSASGLVFLMQLPAQAWTPQGLADLENRLKVFWISRDSFCRVMQAVVRGRGGELFLAGQASVDGLPFLPFDAKLVECCWDWARDSFGLKFRHPSFPVRIGGEEAESGGTLIFGHVKPVDYDDLSESDKLSTLQSHSCLSSRSFSLGSIVTVSAREAPSLVMLCARCKLPPTETSPGLFMVTFNGSKCRLCSACLEEVKLK